jgi:hypothetical protein
MGSTNEEGTVLHIIAESGLVRIGQIELRIRVETKVYHREGSWK